MMISATEARQIASEVVEGRVLNDPVFFLLLLATTIVASALGSYISSYFKKRGEALATKADFQKLLDQLKASTHLAEEIKADVQIEIWRGDFIASTTPRPHGGHCYGHLRPGTLA